METRWSGRSQPGEVESREREKVASHGSLSGAQAELTLLVGRTIDQWHLAPCVQLWHSLAPKDLHICLPWCPELGWTLSTQILITFFILKLKSKWESRTDPHEAMRE